MNQLTAPETVLLTESEIKEDSKRRAWIIGPALFGAVACIFVLFLVAIFFRTDIDSLAITWFGVNSLDFIHFLPIAISLPVFFISILVAEAKAACFKTYCPLCKADVSQRMQFLLRTRYCYECEKRIVAGGREISPAVFRRYCSIRDRAFLKYLLWLWPLFSLLFLGYLYFDRTAFQQRWQEIWLFPFTGTLASGWSWIRTFDRRYFLPLLASFVLLCVSAAIFWYKM